MFWPLALAEAEPSPFPVWTWIVFPFTDPLAVPEPIEFFDISEFVPFDEAAATAAFGPLADADADAPPTFAETPILRELPAFADPALFPVEALEPAFKAALTELIIFEAELNAFPAREAAFGMLPMFIWLLKSLTFLHSLIVICICISSCRHIYSSIRFILNIMFLFFFIFFSFHLFFFSILIVFSIIISIVLNFFFFGNNHHF